MDGEGIVNQVVIGAYGTIGFRAVRVLAHGDTCEPLHGRNFRVQATLRGDLGATDRVIDFLSVNAVLAEFCAGLDGRILIPLRNPSISVRRDDEMWYVAHVTRRWAFPDCDTVALDVVNPTNEMLAAICLRTLRQALHDDPEARLLRHIEVAIGDPEGSAHRAEPWASSSEDL